MSVFTQETLDFFADLANHNDRDWFHSNKKRYESAVKGPFQEFAADMILRMQELDPDISMLPKQAVSRINRDTRFSKDKAPYKTSGYIMISSTGKADLCTPGLYFNLGAKTMAIASGLYMLEPDRIAAVRRHLIANADELKLQLARPEFAKTFGGIKGEVNKILPPEFKEAAKDLPILFNKQFFYWAEYPATAGLRPGLSDWTMDHMRACWPMNEFLHRAFA